MLYLLVAERVLENICEELAIAEVVLVDYTGTKSELRPLEAAQRTITRSEEFLPFNSCENKDNYQPIH